MSVGPALQYPRISNRHVRAAGTRDWAQSVDGDAGVGVGAASQGAPSMKHLVSPCCCVEAVEDDPLTNSLSCQRELIVECRGQCRTLCPGETLTPSAIALGIAAPLGERHVLLKNRCEDRKRLRGAVEVHHGGVDKVRAGCLWADNQREIKLLRALEDERGADIAWWFHISVKFKGTGKESVGRVDVCRGWYASTPCVLQGCQYVGVVLAL